MAITYITHWTFAFEYSAFKSDIPRAYIQNSLGIKNTDIRQYFVVSGGNATVCRQIMERNNGNTIELWNSGTIMSDRLILPPWMTAREIDSFQRDPRSSMTGNTFIDFQVNPAEKGYFYYATSEHDSESPFYWAIYSELFNGQQTGVNAFARLSQKASSITLLAFPYYSYAFLTEDNMPISFVNYSYSSTTQNSLVTGNTGDASKLTGIPGGTSYFRAERPGFFPKIVTSPQYTPQTETPERGAQTFYLTLSGNGEVASNQRLEETFPTLLQGLTNIELYNENYSINQQPQTLTNIQFIYSSIAENDHNLTLRLEDYLYEAPYVPAEDFPENPNVTGAVHTIYWSGETTNIATYTPSIDNPINTVEDLYNLAISINATYPIGYSNSHVIVSQLSISGEIAEFTVPSTSSFMIASPYLNCYLSGATYSKYHSITMLGGSAVYYLRDKTLGTNISYEAFDLNELSAFSTDSGPLHLVTKPAVFTYHTLTNASLTSTNTYSNHIYSINIELTAEVKYALCDACYGNSYNSNDLKLSGSSSIWAEVTAQTINYCGT